MPSARSAWPASRSYCSEILTRSRILAVLGLGGIVADVTVAELGGFKAMNETRSGQLS